MRLLIDVIENHRLFCLLACYCYRCLWWKRNWSWLKLFQKHLLIYIFIQTLDAVVHFFSSFAWLLPHQIRFHRSIKYSFDYTNNMHVYYWGAVGETGFVFFPHSLDRSFISNVCVLVFMRALFQIYLSCAFNEFPLWLGACVRAYVYFAREHKRLLICIKFLSNVGSHYSQCELWIIFILVNMAAGCYVLYQTHTNTSHVYFEHNIWSFHRVFSCLCYYQFSIFSFCRQSSIILKFDRYMCTTNQPLNQHTVNSISQLDRLFHPSYCNLVFYIYMLIVYSCVCV